MSNYTFELHAQLAKDCEVLGHFSLSLLLLMNDSQYPWLILVPQRQGISEIHQLSQSDQQQLMRESCVLAQMLETVFTADKINIAALGNMVPQLHIHHIARFKNDVAWPSPIWGRFDVVPYTQENLAIISAKIVDALMKQQLVFRCEQT